MARGSPVPGTIGVALGVAAKTIGMAHGVAAMLGSQVVVGSGVASGMAARLKRRRTIRITHSWEMDGIDCHMRTSARLQA